MTTYVKPEGVSYPDGSLQTSASTSIIKSIQTGFATPSVYTGSGEDFRYYDVSISSVNTAKSFVYVESRRAKYDGNNARFYKASGRLINSTTVRISVSYYYYYAASARFTVVEYN